MSKKKNPFLRGVSCIYSDLAVKILGDFCEIQCPRASHVETIMDLPEETIERLKEMDKPLDPSLWYVDFSPIGEDIILGPYSNREDALKAEVECLEKKLKEEE